MKKLVSFLLAALMLLFCTGCDRWENPELLPDQIVAVVPEQTVDATVKNPLTGEPLKNPDAVNNRPVACMLNNIHLAMPQHGVSDADIIFEYNVEGGITRMVGFFQELTDVGTIGSTRSARPCFVETVLGMEAIYVHAGGSDEAMWMIYDLEMDDIDEGDWDCFWRDEERLKTKAWEHTLMTSGERLENYFTEHGWERKHSEDFEYPFTYVEDGTPYSDTSATDISVRFSNYKTGTFTYDPETGLYMIGQYGDAYIDGNTGEQVGVTNLLILRTTVYNSGDEDGHMVIDIQGSGSGMYICGGKATEITWHKETMEDPFTYTLPDGTHFSLGVGKSYVCVVSHEAQVTVS